MFWKSQLYYICNSIIIYETKTAQPRKRVHWPEAPRGQTGTQETPLPPPGEPRAGPPPKGASVNGGHLLEEQPVGDVVGSQEGRHQVGDGAGFPTVRPEQERAQTSFPAEQVRQALRQQELLGPTARGPAGRVLAQGLLQGRQSPMAESARLTQDALETVPKCRGQAQMPHSPATPSLRNREGACGRKGPCPTLRPLLPFFSREALEKSLSPIHWYANGQTRRTQRVD